MACTLERRDDGVFEGKTGRTIQIDIDSDQPAALVKLFYGGDLDGEAPFEFKIRKGPQKLLVVAAGVESDEENTQHMRIVERSGGEDCFLRHFFWTPKHFHTTLDIEGV
jgi:hypothetical protein